MPVCATGYICTTTSVSTLHIFAHQRTYEQTHMLFRYYCIFPIMVQVLQVYVLNDFANISILKVFRTPTKVKIMNMPYSSF